MTKPSNQQLVELVEFWQRHHPPLAVDGRWGPNTARSVDETIGVLEKFWPLRCLPDGQQPVITSGFKTENPSRRSHDGVDLFYPWLETDPEVRVGNGGAVKVNGQRRWWYPPGTHAVAAADGIVQASSKRSTGWRIWIDHGNGERTGYMHGLEDGVLVKHGDAVFAGEPLFVVGDNPSVRDPKHLHFEVSPVGEYAPVNPRLWLRGAALFPAAAS